MVQRSMGLVENYEVHGLKLFGDVLGRILAYLDYENID